MNIAELAREEMKQMRAYVPGARQDDVKEKYGIEHVVKLASNENPLGPSPKAVEAIKNMAASIHIYPDSQYKRARKAISEKLNVDPDQLIIGNGGEEVIRLLCETFLNKGDEVVISELGFGEHFIFSQMMGAECVVVPVTEKCDADLDEFLNKITNKTKMIFVTNPNNPTGKIVPRARMEAFLSKIPENILVMIDEAYFEFARLNPDYPDCTKYLDRYKNLFILRTFSKVTGLAGLRVGYGIADKAIIAEINKIKGAFNVNTLAAEVAIAAVNDDEHVQKTLEINTKSLDMMRAYFDKKGYQYFDTATNFIFVDFGINSAILHENLMEKGVILRPGSLWGQENFMRISSGTIEQTEEVLNVLESVL